MNILLIEDDYLLNETLRHYLGKHGYRVTSALNTDEAVHISYKETFDLYLIDINLPDGNGIDLLESLRFAEDETPTIFITALDDIASMARGFELGAMDYIKKPFDPEELLIRIKAKFQNRIIRYGDIVYDPSSKIVRTGDKIVDLSHVQLGLFEKLLFNRGKMVTKEHLFECLEHPSDTALRVALTKLKQKLRIDITNIRGRGYVLEEL